MKSFLSNETKRNLIIDLIIFILFLVVYEVKATGVTIHEWLGVAVGVIAIIHIVLHWKWLVQKTKQFLNRMTAGTRINYIVDVLIFIGFTTIIFTGIMMSESFLPTFGIQVETSHFWREMHSISVDLTLLFTAIHFALHWKWIVCTFKKYILSPIKNLKALKNKTDEVVLKPVEKEPFHFSKMIHFSLRFLLILIISCFISLGWYAVSQTNSSDSGQDFHPKFEQSAENGATMNSPERTEGFNPNHRGHEEPEGMFVLEVLKNLLIFAVVTLLVNKINSRKNNTKQVNSK